MALTKEQRAAISRANGAKSRGPRTIQGKAVSSQNALKTGLTARKLIVTKLESEEEFKRFSAAMRSFYKPTDPMQAYWVNRIVTCLWRVRRANYEEALRIDEENSLSLTGPHHLVQNIPKCEAILNYEEKMMKQVQLAIRELEKLQGASSPTPQNVLDISPTVTIKSGSFEE